ncbi:MAG: hypothetical protein A2X94_05575 [Bdellovibrionales bacterium GWB1_55_8]|nr:MAG: hypothetical protein A2X94_05575 [Bdellovibrionales bacterium GWB1_55_8]
MRIALGLLVALCSFSAFGGERVCILSIFANDSKESAKVEKAFRKYPEIEVFQAPRFEEIRACFNGEYDEVLWVSHGTVTGVTTPYFTPVFVDGDTGKKSLLYPRFFEAIARGLPERPITLRVASCGADDDRLQNTMTPLFEAIRSRGGTVEFAPRLRLASWLSGKSMTNLSRSWLQRSAKGH